MAAQPATHGFWRGFLVGLILAAAGVLALAWFYPPRPLLPPEVDAGALEAPGAPGLPAGAAEPAPPGPEGALPAAPTAPAIAGNPAPDAAPEMTDGAAALPPRAAP
jgi:hypothetical protein